MSTGASEARGNGAAEAARRAREASRKLAVLSEKLRNEALRLAAERLEENEGQIVAANADVMIVSLASGFILEVLDGSRKAAVLDHVGIAQHF